MNSVVAHVLYWVNKSGGIEKIRSLHKLFRELDKQDPEKVRKFVESIGKDVSKSRAFCSAALLGFALGETIYNSVVPAPKK
jgi:hypothetical protein